MFILSSIFYSTRIASIGAIAAAFLAGKIPAIAPPITKMPNAANGIQGFKTGAAKGHFYFAGGLSCICYWKTTRNRRVSTPLCPSCFVQMNPPGSHPHLLGFIVIHLLNCCLNS